MTRYVAVCGAGDPAPDTDALAYEVGRLLAEAGAVVVCGGLGGVMQAACRGAKEAGGTTVGLLPGEDRSHANPYVDVAIPTGMGEMRNALIVRSADAVIAIGGGWGTLSEVAFAMKTRTPVVTLSSWELPEPDGRTVQAVESAEEAVRIALDRRP